MSKYNYPNWHAIKDLVMIYHDDMYDDAEVCVWSPNEQRSYDISFCGSSKPEFDTTTGDILPAKINFIITQSKGQENEPDGFTKGVEFGRKFPSKDTLEIIIETVKSNNDLNGDDLINEINSNLNKKYFPKVK